MKVVAILVVSGLLGAVVLPFLVGDPEVHVGVGMIVGFTLTAITVVLQPMPHQGVRRLGIRLRCAHDRRIRDGSAHRHPDLNS